MDALSETLKVLRLTSGIFLEADFSAPWCVDSAPGEDDISHFLPDAEHVAIFHLLVEGAAGRLADGGEVLDLAAGDLLMFPHSDTHVLGSDLHLNPTHAASLVRPDAASSGLMRIRHGGSGPRTRFICGYWPATSAFAAPFCPGFRECSMWRWATIRQRAGWSPALQHGAQETHARNQVARR